MNTLDLVNAYLRGWHSRLRWSAVSRGAALCCAVALVATLALVLITNSFAFSATSMLTARLALFLALAAAAGFALLLPLLRLNRRAAASRAERAFPEFEQRLLTLAEKSPARDASDPFLELLAEDALAFTEHARPEAVVSGRRIAALFSAAAVAAAVLLWLVLSGPGYLGHGASLLWVGARGEGFQPFYDIRVSPGDHAVRRKADQLVTASLIGFQAPEVRLHARFHSASKWERIPMQPEPSGTGFEFLFASIPDSVDYYVEAGAVRSRQYTLRVIDMPAVKRIRVTYHYPAWTGLQRAVEEHGGDLRAVEGTEAELAVETDRPLGSGLIVLDDDRRISLEAGAGNWSTARLRIQKDGLYHIAALDQGRPIRLTEGFMIEAMKELAPVVRIRRPGRDYRASPIEEVTVAVEAEDDFGLQELSLRYSVNGGEEQTIPLLERKGLRQTGSSTVIYLEDFQLVPGDLVSLYAVARDARAASRTDMYFIEAQPFEREYTQSQVMGGSGGGAGQEQNQISQRQKEIIAATWNQLREPGSGDAPAAEVGKFLAEVQSKLRDQARSLANRMRSRQLSSANQELSSFSRDMQAAAEAMGEAAEKLKAARWREALAPEQKALQHLLRAESTFREIQVAMGSRGGGGGGGGGLGRDLENLFDLELDTEKNQYETGQQSASADQRAREIDEALQRLEQLARRQQEFAARQPRSQQSFQQRWQQEMLRREAEQLQRRMEELARGQSGSQSQSSPGGQSAAQGALPRRSAGRAGADPRLEQALERLRQATEDMRRAGSAASGDSSQAETQSRRAAERLQEATDLLGRMRRQEASQQLGDMAGRADRLAELQRDFAERMRRLYAGRSPTDQQQQPGISRQQLEELSAEKRQMTGELERLERQMQEAVRDLASSQRAASSRLREALGDLQQQELVLRMKYAAEWIRRGLGAYAWTREGPMAQALDQLREQIRQAEQALDRASPAQGDLERALAQLEQLRGRMDGLSRGQPSEGSQPRGAGAPQAGSYSAMNLGDRLPPPGAALPPSQPALAELERAYREGLRDLSRLRQSVQDNPEVARDIQELIREMQRLDPSRFPGNPELVERLRTQVLPGLEQLELMLRRRLEEAQSGQVRSGSSEPVPAGYAEAVAEYFRRLSKNP